MLRLFVSVLEANLHDGVIKWKKVLFGLYARANSWVNNRGAGDLRRHRVYYDVNVMESDIHAPVIKLTT